MTGRSTLSLTLHGETDAAGTVWLTAFWFNGRKETGGAGPPVSVNLAAVTATPQVGEGRMRIAA